MMFNMIRLCVMMFLQFFVWGAWYVSITGFLGKEEMGDITGAVYTVGPLAAIIAPFFLGMIADRFFSTERVLGFLHLAGGGLLLVLPLFAAPFLLPEMPEDASLFYKVIVHDLPAYVQPFTLLLLLHMCCYMPTLGLTASLSFNHLTNQEKQFPVVRVMGTLGWICGNLAVGFLPGGDSSVYQFYLAGGAGLLLGLFSFFLPHTPPPSKGKKVSIGEIIGLDSLSLLKKPSYSVFILCSFLLCIPLAGYYAQARNYVDASDAAISLTSIVGLDSNTDSDSQTTEEEDSTNGEDATNEDSANEEDASSSETAGTDAGTESDATDEETTASTPPADEEAEEEAEEEVKEEGDGRSATTTMSLGQMSEVFFMLVMPLFFIRLGVKNMLAVGMLAWVVRYGLFAAAAENEVFWMILVGIILHGICYDFFFVTGMIYVDKAAPKKVRGQAQGFLVLVTQGLGLGIGAKLFFAHVEMNTSDGVADWNAIWTGPAIFAGVVLVLFYLCFWGKINRDDEPKETASDVTA